MEKNSPKVNNPTATPCDHRRITRRKFDTTIMDEKYQITHTRCSDCHKTLYRDTQKI
jgi:hypothetical protein